VPCASRRPCREDRGPLFCSVAQGWLTSPAAFSSDLARASHVAQVFRGLSVPTPVVGTHNLPTFQRSNLPTFSSRIACHPVSLSAACRPFAPPISPVLVRVRRFAVRFQRPLEHRFHRPRATQPCDSFSTSLSYAPLNPRSSAGSSRCALEQLWWLCSAEAKQMTHSSVSSRLLRTLSRKWLGAAVPASLTSEGDKT